MSPQFATVQVNIAGVVTDPSYRPQDGDSSFLDAGTPVYMLRGYDARFRLVAPHGSGWVLYEADRNPAARRGEDLLDIRGRVAAVELDATDGRPLTTVSDPSQIETLLNLVLDAPVDQSEATGSGPRFFIVFHLQDGTEASRAYWPESGLLERGVHLPSSFAAALERALPAS